MYPEDSLKCGLEHCGHRYAQPVMTVARFTRSYNTLPSNRFLDGFRRLRAGEWIGQGETASRFQRLLKNNVTISGIWLRRFASWNWKEGSRPAGLTAFGYPDLLANDFEGGTGKAVVSRGETR